MGFFSTFLQILPVFLIMGVGMWARRLGFLTGESIPVLNRLTYYIAIPVMIFSEISKSQFHRDLDGITAASTMAVVVPGALFAYLSGRFCKVSKKTLASLIQASIHGNLGYLGLAISFYVMGAEGLVKASILAGFLIIVQNVVSVVALTSFGKGSEQDFRLQRILKNVIPNPIIVAAALGILFSALEIGLPSFLKETMQLLSRMAMPLALLTIGASLKAQVIGKLYKEVSAVILLKLLLLPSMGLLLLWLTKRPITDIQAAIILLCSPTATVTYVMAAEMGGDTSFSTAAVSLSTLFSIFTYTFWVWVMGFLPLK